MRPTRPKVSVVIPTYNRAHCLGEALDSVIAQTYQDFEIIVVDDGSTDETANILKRYSDRVRYIHQHNQGVSAARNTGIAASLGEWIAFLDSDDLWNPDKLRVQMSDLEKYPDAVAHLVDTEIIINKDKRISLFDLRGMHKDYKVNPVRIRPLFDVFFMPFSIQASIIRRNSLYNAGLYNRDIKIFEDIDLLLRVALEGSFIVNCYIGTLVRRFFTANDLSNTYNQNFVQSIFNVIHAYSNLLRDPRVNDIERKRIRCIVGGSYCELAQHQATNHDITHFFINITKSIIVDPGLRSIGRALYYATGLRYLANRFGLAGGKFRLRRSEWTKGLKY